jgi:eukaryotic-like serine/threonine-protein kinase
VTQPATGFLLAGRYRLSHELAHGGMGYVWVADDETSEQRVAIKFQAEPRRDAIADRRFRREAQALAQLESPHIVRVLTSGTDAGLSYIVMELLHGETLRQRCAARRPVEPAQAVAWIRQAAEGLGVAHRAGIIHRDVKPSNLFLASTPDGEVLKIIDFGIAKGHVLDGTSDGTASGLIGSPCYMSPEQARGESVDARSDLWALGVVAFQLLTGREPFMGANVPQTLQRICSGSVPRISEFAGELPSSLDAFFRRAFAADRALRFESAAEFAHAFARACEGEAPQGLVGRSDTTQSIAMQMPSVRPARPRRPRVILGAAAAVGVIAVMLWRVAPKVEEPVSELVSDARAAAFSAEVVAPSLSPNAPPAVLLSAAPLPSSTAPAAATLSVRVRQRPIAPKPSAAAQAVPTAPALSPPPPKPEASRPAVDQLDRRF